MEDTKLKEAVKNRHIKASLELLEQSIALMNIVNESYAEELQNIHDNIKKELVK